VRLEDETRITGRSRAALRPGNVRSARDPHYPRPYPQVEFAQASIRDCIAIICGEFARLKSGTLDKKKRQFLANPAGTCYSFSERSRSLADASQMRRATRALAVRTGNDSGMAPQVIEIAQNGLGNGELPVCGCSVGENGLLFGQSYSISPPSYARRASAPSVSPALPLRARLLPSQRRPRSAKASRAGPGCL
jgi:hypothetical protein